LIGFAKPARHRARSVHPAISFASLTAMGLPIANPTNR